MSRIEETELKVQEFAEQSTGKERVAQAENLRDLQSAFQVFTRELFNKGTIQSQGKNEANELEMIVPHTGPGIMSVPTT